MGDSRIVYSVFTKPWREMSAAELAEHVHNLGFDGVEFPVRPGYQVEPENVRQGLPELARRMAEWDVQIYSVAGPTDEATIAACAEAGVPTIRICVTMSADYMADEAQLRREYDALVPLLDKYGVRLGIQNHNGRNIANAMACRHLVEGYDPRHLGIVWDAAHEALAGTEPELALDIAWSHLCLVNLKNGLWQRTNGPEAEVAEWRTYWTGGRYGLASWPRVAAELQRRGYEGVVCLTAEYSDHDAVNRLIAEDIAFARSLFDCGAGPC
jgi:sugar phosphate isomerase/epimerase